MVQKRKGFVTALAIAFALLAAVVGAPLLGAYGVESARGGAAPNSGVLTSHVESQRKGPGLNISVSWSASGNAGLGIDAQIDFSHVQANSEAEAPVVSSFILAEGLSIDDATLEQVVSAWRDDEANAGLAITVSSEWVTVSETGDRVVSTQAAEHAVQKIAIEVGRDGDAGDSVKSPCDITLTLPLSLSADLQSYVASAKDSATAYQTVFLDAKTAVQNDEGLVQVSTVNGAVAAIAGEKVSVPSPVLLCANANTPQTPPVSARTTADAPADKPWHVAGFTLDQVFSGTATFNEADGAGEDSGAANDVLRSYDSVIYSTSYALVVDEGFGTAKSGKLKVSATLPLTDDLMTWDLDSMVWLKNAHVTTSDKKQTVTGDVVFGGDSSAPVAPSVGMLNFVAKVRDVSQGQAIDAPEFTLQRYADDGLAMQGEQISCGTVDGKLQNVNPTVKNANLKGSAKGCYNAQLRAEGNNRYTVTLQMRSESGGLKGIALPKEQQVIEVDFKADWGQNFRAVKVNAIGAAQGLGSRVPVFSKEDYGGTAPFGRQPDGTAKTTFNTVFNSGDVIAEAIVDDAGNGTYATWTLSMVAPRIDRANIDKIAVTHNASRESANEEPDYDRDIVYNFGSYLFEVEGPKYDFNKHTTWVEITGLRAIDSAGAAVSDCYSADDKCSQIHSGTGQVQGTTGFHINYNTEIKYIPSTELIGDDGGLIGFPDINGTSSTGVYEVSPGDSFVTASNNQYYCIDNDVDSYFSRKDAPRYITKFLKFDDEVFEVDESHLDLYPPRASVFSQDLGWDHHGYADVIAKYVTKPAGWTSDSDLLSSHLTNDHATHFEDKPNDGLRVYNTYEEADNSGEPIVGIVFDILVDDRMIDEHFAYRNEKGELATSLYVQIRSIPLRIRTDAAVRDGQVITEKDDARLVGMMTWDSLTSCVNMYKTETNYLTGKTEYVNTHAYARRSGTQTTPGKWQWINRGDPEKFSESIETNYEKARYDKDGNVVFSGSTDSKLNGSAGYDGVQATGGASFYVRLNGVDVSKKVAQQSDGVPKVNFDLDQGQRRVDFYIDTLHTGSDRAKLTDTVTLTDDIPAGMNPVNPGGSTPGERWGIAYGGVYRQDENTNGGAGGSWVSSGGDVVSTDPANTAAWAKMQAVLDTWPGSPSLSCNVAEQSNPDGSTTLTWVFENVPVSYGLPKIHYSVRLGSTDDPFNDLVNGDSVVNKMTGKLTTSGAQDVSESAVAVVRAQSAAVIKEPKVEKRSPKGTDPMGFDITFVNNANEDAGSLTLLSVVDILPGADDKSWSTTAEGITELEGYKLENVTFDAQGLPEGESLYMAYMVNGPGCLTRAQMREMQQTGTLYGSMINIDYQSDGWRHVSISFNKDGSLSAASKEKVQKELSGREVTAVGFFTLGKTAVPAGGMFKLGYEYGWTDDQVQLLHNVSDSFTNTVTLSSHALKKSVESKATTLPTPSDMDFTFTKTDGKDGFALAGAEFKLFRWVGSGEPPTTGLIDPSSYDERKWQLVGTRASGEDGVVAFEALGSLDGSPHYRLVETKAPEGYLLPGGQWRVNVDVINERVDVKAVDGDDGAQPPAFDNSESKYKLPNYRPIDIPSSGGRGITGFVGVGMALCAVGVRWMSSRAAAVRRR